MAHCISGPLLLILKLKALLIGFIKSQTKLLWNLNRSRQNLTWRRRADAALRLKRDCACRLAVFRLLSIQELQALAGLMDVCSRDPGEVIVAQGDEPYHVYFVVEGEVELVRDLTDQV